LALWALWRTPILANIVVCYLLAWSIHNYSPLGQFIEQNGEKLRSKLISASIVSFALVFQFLLTHAKPLFQNELFAFVAESASDRWYLENKTIIAPRVLSLDHPQSFYIYAPNAKELGLRLDSNTATISALALGHNLFRADVNPKRLSMTHVRSGIHEIELLVDDKIDQHEMLIVQPRTHPKKFSALPQNGIVAAVSESTDELLILRRNGTLVRSPVQDGPSDCAFIDRKGTIAVSHRYSDELWILESRKGMTNKQIKLYGPQTSLAVSPERTHLAIAIRGNSTGIQMLALPRFNTTSFIDLEFEPDWIGFGDDSDTLIMSDRRNASLHRYRRTGRNWKAVAPVLKLKRPAVTHRLSPDRQKLYLAVTDHHSDTDSDSEQNHYIQDQIVTVDLKAWQIRDRIVSFGAKHVDGAPRLHGASPISIDFADHDKMAIVFAGTDEVWFVDTSTETGPLTRSVSLSAPAPQGVASLGRGIWAIFYPASGTIHVINENGRVLRRYDLEPQEKLVASDPYALEVRKGEEYFYEATRAGASCQSCHLNADSDYAQHEIGQGRAAPTLSARGAGFTAPFLRGASYPSISSLEHVVLDILGGYSRPRAQRGEKIETFVNSLTRLPPDREISDSDYKKGLDAFVKAKCNTCHSFPYFTNLQQVSESFLFPDRNAEFAWLDTPTLLSVSTSPPYLYDGRAHTLREVLFKYNKSNRHGDIAALSDLEKNVLVKFLEAL
jgi:hypothetical protein